MQSSARAIHVFSWLQCHLIGLPTCLQLSNIACLGSTSHRLFAFDSDSALLQECFNPAGLAQRAISNVKKALLWLSRERSWSVSESGDLRKAFPDVALLPHFTYMCRNLVVDFV